MKEFEILFSSLLEEQENSCFLEEFKHIISTASQVSCLKIAKLFKSNLKINLNTKGRFLLKLIDESLSLLNIRFIYEISLKLVPLLIKFMKSPGLNEEFYSDLLLYTQDWGLKFGEIANELTLFNKAYTELLTLSNRPPCFEYGYKSYLKIIIDTRGSIFYRKQQMADKCYSKLLHEKQMIDNEISLKADKGIEIERLLFINDLMVETIQEYQSFQALTKIPENFSLHSIKLAEVPEFEEVCPKAHIRRTSCSSMGEGIDAAELYKSHEECVHEELINEQSLIDKLHRELAHCKDKYRICKKKNKDLEIINEKLKNFAEKSHKKNRKLKFLNAQTNRANSTDEKPIVSKNWVLFLCQQSNVLYENNFLRVSAYTAKHKLNIGLRIYVENRHTKPIENLSSVLCFNKHEIDLNFEDQEENLHIEPKGIGIIKLNFNFIRDLSTFPKLVVYYDQSCLELMLPIVLPILFNRGVPKNTGFAGSCLIPFAKENNSFSDVCKTLNFFKHFQVSKRGEMVFMSCEEASMLLEVKNQNIHVKIEGQNQSIVHSLQNLLTVIYK